jgi:hypothetical protein
MPHALLVLLICLGVGAVACSLEDDSDPGAAHRQPVSQPFTPSTQGPSLGGGVPVSGAPPAATTCTLDDPLLRCVGDTLQVCEEATADAPGVYEELVSCDVIGQECSQDPQDCGGLVDTACCMTR